jgi:hypothetical protein
MTEYHDPSIFDRMSGAWLAFRTDISDWEPGDPCIYCGATEFVRTVNQVDHETRCFNCGTTGYGGPSR